MINPDNPLLALGEPFVVCIGDSLCVADGYDVTLTVHNLDIHALYVESLRVLAPLKLKAVSRIVRKEMDFGPSTKDDGLLLPHRMRSGDSIELRVTATLPSSRKQFGTVRFRVSRLAQKSVEDRDVAFLIRHSRQ